MFFFDFLDYCVFSRCDTNPNQAHEPRLLLAGSVNQLGIDKN